MNVLKFGGAVLKTPDGFEKMAEIISGTKDEPLLIIISAFSKATSKLKNAAITAEQDDDMKALSIVKGIVDEYRFFADKIISNKDISNALNQVFEEGEDKIGGYIRGVNITRELTPRTLDAILSFGEYFALHTVHHFLQEKGMDIRCIDSTSILVSNSNYGNADPLIDLTNEKVEKILKPALNKHGKVVTQGFVAMDTKGEVTTMGIESSNLTATLLAGLLGAKSITFYTDVPGICNSDPKLTENPKTINTINYDDAYNLAARGLKLIYPPMIDLARKYSLELIYSSAFDISTGSTTINNGRSSTLPTTIILRQNLNLFIYSFREFSGRKEFQKKFTQFLNLNSNEFYFDSAADSLLILTEKNKLAIDPEIESKNIRNISSISLVNLENYMFLNLTKSLKKHIDKNHIYGIYFYPEKRLANLIVSGEIDQQIIKVISELPNRKL